MGGREGSWRSFLATCEEFQVDVAGISQAWQVYRRANLATIVKHTARRKLAGAVKALHAFQIAEKALTVEQEREQMNFAEVQSAAKLRESLAAQIRAETKAMMAEASIEALRYPPPPLTPPTPPAPPPAPIVVPERELPVVDDDGQVDLLRDVRWVYANLPRLVVRDDTGRLKLNVKELKKAPSNGAVSLAEYALRDRDKFFDRFVIKLLPRDTTSTVAEVAEGASAPSFSPMAEFIRKSGAVDEKD